MSTDEEWLQITTLPYLVTSIGPVASWSVDDYVAVATEKVVYVLDATVVTMRGYLMQNCTLKSMC